MKNIILSVTAVLMMISGAASAESMTADKPISKVSDVQNMPDDTMVYVQGFITEDLGDEKYTFQDDSGTLTVEIDGDLMQNHAVMPTTMVWIAAEVDKKGNIVELDAEEIQLIPTAQTNASLSTKMSNQ